MHLTKYEEAKQFIINNIHLFISSGGGGDTPKLPPFEIQARDFLEFAESELIEDSIKSRVNCISNLKRAVDCQLDTFLYVYNLYDMFSSKNLKFDKKLEFLRVAGIISPRSLSKLNLIRNKLEHHYEIPKTEELEVYYDLVSAFISVIESKIIGTHNSSIEFEIETSVEDSTNNESINKWSYFSIEYLFITKPQICVSWRTTTEEKELVVEAIDYIQFAYFLKLYFLFLYRDVYYNSDNYIISKLNEQ